MYVKTIDYAFSMALIAAVCVGPRVFDLLVPDLAVAEKTEEAVREAHLRSETYEFATEEPPVEDAMQIEEKQTISLPPTGVVAVKSLPPVSGDQNALESKDLVEGTKDAVVVAAVETAEGLTEVLNGEEAEALEELVAEGQSLIAEGANYPAYTADLPQDQLERILQRGLAKLVVTAGTDHLFVFPGPLLAPGRARLACRGDLAGFSARALFIDGPGAREMVRRVGDEFNFARHKLAAAVVLQANLDAAVLASQRRAAEALGLSIGDVRLTDGEFRTARGLPWRYCVSRVCLGDGRCLAVERSPVVHAVAQGGSD